MTTDNEPLPCRLCNGTVRVEKFPLDVVLWVCSNSTHFGGNCDGEAYFSPEAWNDRSDADNEPPVDDGLVERLRDYTDNFSYDIGMVRGIMREAADTITRLRAAIASSDENVKRYAQAARPYYLGHYQDQSSYEIARAVLAAIRQKADTLSKENDHA